MFITFNDTLLTDSIEEIKNTSNIKNGDNKYRFVYTKKYNNYSEKNTLKIEINTKIEDVLEPITKLLKKTKFKRVHIYLKYKYILRLGDNLLVICQKLEDVQNRVKIAYLQRNYKDEDYILLFEVCQ